MMYSFIQSP